MNSHFNVLIIGGGIAGITAAWELRKAGADVTLLESRAQLGGRLASHYSTGFPTPFDNGPHLFLNTYTQTLRLLREWGISDSFVFPYPGRIHFVGQNGQRGSLGEWPLPAPFNLAGGLLGLNLLPGKARYRILKTSKEIMTHRLPVIESVASWLQPRSTTQEREIFWNPLIHAALNAPGEAVPASYLEVILKQGFCRGFWGGRLGYAVHPLGDIFGVKALEKLKTAGVNIQLKTTALDCVINAKKDHQITGVRTNRGEYISGDVIIAAMPPWAAAQFLDRVFIPSQSKLARDIQLSHQLDQWQANPITTIYLWAENRPWLEAYTALPGRSIGWVFDFARLWNDGSAPIAIMLEFPTNHTLGDITKSDTEMETNSHPLIEIDRILTDLFSAFPQLAGVQWQTVKMIRERRSTPLRPRSLWGKELASTTAVSNLFLAGDWLDETLPPTVEAAVRSGLKAKNLIVG